MNNKKSNQSDATLIVSEPDATPICGIVRPIAAIDGCTDAHWEEVHSILSDAIVVAGFTPNLVSAASESGIIQQRIVQNLYLNDIVVCDISAKNPNVMFELGMRLAFDKPTIVIKDDMTPFSFDTSPIEHLQYRRDLRFSSVNEFKDRLAKQIKATYEKSKSDPNYSTFLKHFGTFTIAKIEHKEVSKEDFIISAIEQLTRKVESISGLQSFPISSAKDAALREELVSGIVINLGNIDTKSRMRLVKKLQEDWRIKLYEFENDMDNSTLRVFLHKREHFQSVSSDVRELIESIRNQ